MNRKISIMSKNRCLLGNVTGISLVEMMIAMLVSLILLGGMYRLFISSSTGYDFESEMSNLQENGRFTLEFLTRDIRMAGYRGCAGRNAEIFSTLNNGSDFLYNFGQAIVGYDNMTSPPPTDLSAIAPVAGTDVLVLRRQISDNAVQITKKMPDTSADLTISNNPSEPIKTDDIVMITDCQASTVFQVTHANYPTSGADANMVHNTGTSSPGNFQKELHHSYDEGAEISVMETQIYFVGLNGATGRPGLFQRRGGTNEEIVGGVENMQITYGVDTSDDGAIDSYVVAGGVADWNDVLAVRIGLLIASLDEIPRAEIDNAARNVNGVAVAAANDRRLRYVFVTTVAIRNRLE
ncbi:MAG: PilW family protein [Syntrophotaleaceae bacterium]